MCGPSCSSVGSVGRSEDWSTGEETWGWVRSGSTGSFCWRVAEGMLASDGVRCCSDGVFCEENEIGSVGGSSSSSSEESLKCDLVSTSSSSDR